jgi:hypothetical protein
MRMESDRGRPFRIDIEMSRLEYNTLVDMEEFQRSLHTRDVDSVCMGLVKDLLMLDKPDVLSGRGEARFEIVLRVRDGVKLDAGKSSGEKEVSV